MKAMVMKMMDTNNPSKEILGIKIVEKRKVVYLFDKAKKSFWEAKSIDECNNMVNKINHILKSKTIEDIFLIDKKVAYAIEVTSLIKAEAGKMG